MEQSFYQWSIPHYFIHKYFSPTFHSDCIKDEHEYKQADHFLEHLIEYLMGFWQIRGKWINSFILTQQEISQILKQENNQNYRQNIQPPSFLSLLTTLPVKLHHILFIKLIINAIKIYQSDDFTHKKTLIQAIVKTYFKYRVEISLDDENKIDIGQPLLMEKLFSIIYEKVKEKPIQKQLLAEISTKCDLQHVYAKFCMEKQGQKTQQQQEMKKSATEETIQNQNLNKNSQQNYEEHPNKCGNEQIKKNEQSYQLRYTQKQMSSNKSVKKAIQKRDMRVVQIARKTVKTTRNFNFKGKYFHKMENLNIMESQTYVHQKITHTKKDTPHNLKEQKDISEDFLCDKSM